MARKVLIQIRRGLEKDIGVLAEGELGYCTDTKKLYVGTVAKNELLVAAQTVGDMLKSVYDTNNDGIVDRASQADSIAWGNVTGKPATFAPSTHNHDVLKNKPDNFRDALVLPSTYDTGETIFFSNNPANKFNGVSYCTVHTIRGYSGFANCIQYIYPYNIDAPIMYRYSIYNSDSWESWRAISIEGHTHTKAEIEAKLTGNITTHTHSQYVTNATFNSLEIGGRNLLLNSQNITSISTGGVGTFEILSGSHVKVKLTGAGTVATYLGDGAAHTHLENNVTASENIVISFERKTNSGALTIPTVHLHSQLSYRNMVAMDSDAIGKWVKFYVVVPYVKRTSGTSNIHINNLSVGEHELRNFKIEKGDKATDWTIAPEDLATSKEMQQALDGKMKKGSLTWNDLKGV